MFKKFFENVIKPKENLGGKIMVKGMNKGHEKLASWARSFLNIKEGDRIIDLGCGGGRNVQYFSTKAKYVYGLDYSKMSVKVSRELNEKEIKAGRCEIFEGDVSEIPFEDESLDIVTAFETIYFWKDIEKAFKEIHRVLGVGGTFLICNEGSARENSNIKKWADMLDFNVYTGDELIEILEKIGFAAEYYLDEKKHIVVIAKKL
jgi:methyltransferase